MATTYVCELDDIEAGEIFQAEVPKLGKIALYRVDDQVFATTDTCTHGEASLAEDGYQEGYKVICSWHDGAFDIRIGAVCSLPCSTALKTYQIVVSENAVSIVT